MRTVQRNKRVVWYSFYVGETELVDESGNYTGENNVEYTEPVKALMNVSGGRGQADVALFGLTQNFSITAVTEDLETPFATDMVFWVDRSPSNKPFNYRVAAVARTVNQVVLALEEVDVTKEETVSA